MFDSPTDLELIARNYGAERRMKARSLRTSSRRRAASNP